MNIKIRVTTFLTLFLHLFILFGCMSNQGEESGTLHWIEEKSYFVDYVIEGDTVIFKYSICFFNDSDSDYKFSLCASFSKKDLAGWVEKQDFFTGYDENGDELYYTVKQGEEVNVVFCFKGKYLGGSINSDLSFPDKLIIQLIMDQYNKP